MNYIYQKYIILFIILSSLLFSLTGCISNTQIDDLAYVIAIGIDSRKFEYNYSKFSNWHS